MAHVRLVYYQNSKTKDNSKVQNSALFYEFITKTASNQLELSFIIIKY